jgi:acetate---CoA ligase (ADP-forming)
MSSDRLDAILKPRSIAVIGASRKPDTIGHQIVRNLIDFRFTGSVYPVNPGATSICSIPCAESIEQIGRTIDLAVIAVPRDHVVSVAASCGRAGVRGLVVISAGFREVGAEGAAHEAKLLAEVRTHGMRLVGPNCMGVLNTDPAISMNATFAPIMPPAGGFAFMSQSGALGLSLLDYASEYGIGISQFVSVGNKPDVSGNDLLQQWEHDDAVRAILMYVENFGNPRRFLEIAARITRQKPIIALKSGRSRIGARAAASHTGALAASDLAVDALLQQAGVLRASSVEELFDMAIAFGVRALPRSRNTAVLTNAGGPGILAADAMAAYDLPLAELRDTTLTALSTLLPAEASLRNPLDMIASARPSTYRAALSALLQDQGIDAVVAIFVPPMGVRQQDVAEAVVKAAAATPDKPTIAVLMGREGLPQGRAELHEAGIPAYIFPESAARGLAALNRYYEWLQRPEEAAPELSVDRAEATRLIECARRSGRCALDQVESLALLEAYGVPATRSYRAVTSAEAVNAARMAGYPVVLKLDSPDVSHKTEVDGVRLNLRDDKAVLAAWKSLVGAERNAVPRQIVRGVVVQHMHAGAVELIVGANRDPVFGPLIMFGTGGTFVEVVRDVAFRVAPLKRIDARDLIESIRAQKVLDGFRGGPAVDRDALIQILLRVSRLLIDFPEISELDLNPLLAGPTGVVAVDARVSFS